MADDYRPVAALVEVEGVQRLTVFEHHVVGNVHHVVDGALPRLDERVPHPLGGWPYLHARNQAGGVSEAEVGVGYLDRRQIFYRLALFGIRNVGLRHARAANRRDFVGDSQDGQAVRAVGRDFGVQDGVSQILRERRADGGVRVENEDAVMIVAKTELQRRADHPARFDAADAGALERLGFAGARAEERRALAGEGDFLPRRHVRRAADDRLRSPAADVHRDQPQTVGVRMRLDAQRLAHDDLIGVPVRANDAHLADFDSRHRELMRQLMRRIRRGDVFFEPREGY